LHFYTNGQLEEKVTYKDGKQDGLKEVFNDDGSLYSSATYKDGVKQ